MAGTPFDEALALHQNGRIAEAEEGYRQVLHGQPDHPGALHLLGVTRQQQGDYQAALEFIGRAIAINPRKAVYRNNYGAAQQSLGRHEEAAESFQRALAIAPYYADALANLGMAQTSLGCETDAIASYQRALAIEPRHRDARRRLAALLSSLDRLQEAVALYGQAAITERSPADLLEMGDLLISGGRPAAAAEYLRELTAREPGNAKAHFLLACAYETEQRIDEARTCFEEAARLRQDKPLWKLRARVCAPAVWKSAEEVAEYCGRLDEAVEEYKCSEPSPPAPLPEVEESRSPSDLVPLPEVEGTRSPSDPVQLPGREESEQRSSLSPHPSSFGCPSALAALPAVREYLMDVLEAGAFPSIAFSYLGLNPRALKTQFARLYEPCFSGMPPPQGSGLADRKRVGILVTRPHEAMFLKSMQGIIERLDPKHWETTILAPRGSVARIRPEIGRTDLDFVPFGEALGDAIEQIRRARCDLIYYWEVGTDAMNYFLPFARLAPVQATGWGSTITSGVPAVDYFLSSELVEQAGSESQYTERLWKSRSLFRYQDRLGPLPPGGRSEFGLPDDANLYVCFQNPLKLHPDFDRLLAGILDADRRGLVVLQADRNHQIAGLLKDRFARRISEAADRITLLPFQNFPAYCRLIQLADVVLDPVHYGAGSTCYDLFSYNLPVVTLPGELIIGRVTQACYRKMKVCDLIVDSPQAYVEKAVQVATERDYRAYMVEKIAQSSEVLFNDIEVVREHERFFAKATGIKNRP